MTPWEKKEAYIVKIDDRFQSRLASIEPLITSRIKEILSRTISTTSGQITVTDKLFEELATFQSSIINLFRQSGYVDIVNSLISDLSGIDPFTVSTQKAINKIDVKKFIAKNPVKNIQIQRVIENLRGSGIQQALLTPMNDILISQATGGISIVDATAKLTEFLSSSGNNELLNYAGRAATDGINKYNGSINQAIATEYELEAIRYVGSIIATSRAFCIEMVSKPKWALDDVQPVIDKYASKSGLLYGYQTDKNNIIVNCGGIRCRHEAIPTNE